MAEGGNPAVGRPTLPVGRDSFSTVRLPPLNLFRTFEAAAWHGSFTLAAGELNVTQSAVSQQVRLLEEHLGVTLFIRLPRRMQLTAEGAIFANSIRESLAMMGRACARLQDPGRPATLTVDAYPSFGTRWLGGRITGFLEAYPGIQATVIGSKEPVQFKRNRVDVAVRWGRGDWPGVEAVSLGEQPILAVCAPSYRAANPGVTTPADLLAQPLLHTMERNHWPAWFEAAGMVGVPLGQGTHFGDATMMLEACAQGQGIGLASYFLVQGDLRAGRLVRAVEFAIEIGEGFHMLWQRSAGDLPVAKAFRDWLAETTAKELATDEPWIRSCRHLDKHS